MWNFCSSSFIQTLKYTSIWSSMKAKQHIWYWTIFPLLLICFSCKFFMFEWCSEHFSIFQHYWQSCTRLCLPYHGFTGKCIPSLLLCLLWLLLLHKHIWWPQMFKKKFVLILHHTSVYNMKSLECCSLADQNTVTLFSLKKKLTCNLQMGHR